MTLTDRVIRLRVAISFVLFLAIIIQDVISARPPASGWSQAPDWPGVLGVFGVIFGLAIRSWAAGVLPKGIDLATQGPYSLCRHPLYFGSFLMMVGFSLLLGHLHEYVVVFGPITAIYCLTIRAEERKLEAVYGKRWREYSASVPAFVPWLPSAYRHKSWSIAQWRRSREYRAVATALLGLMAIEIWRNFHLAPWLT
jgi:protein-S-isoprenylcysteine O-methyltransferase Ste14